MLRVPRSGVRPTQDQLRQAVFSAIGPAVADARVLDCFAGTGAYGLDALSRGAAEVCWIERAAGALRTLKENVAALCGTAHPTSRVLAGDVFQPGMLDRAGTDFDLVFADPPYGPGEEERMGDRFLKLMTGPVLRPGGWVVWESPAAVAPPPPPPGWRLVRDRRVGGSAWRLYGKPGN
jgi:16S rRNA (guanine966-N2)-methyltransferase